MHTISVIVIGKVGSGAAAILYILPELFNATSYSSSRLTLLLAVNSGFGEHQAVTFRKGLLELGTLNKTILW